MAKIIVNAESFATEQTLKEVLAAASQANSNNAADVIRDSNGKVVKVMVNLPSNTSAEGLAIAAAAINANSGVATTVTLPKGDPAAEAKDFDAEEDAVLASDAGGAGVLIDVNGASVSLAGYGPSGIKISIASEGASEFPAVEGKSVIAEALTPSINNSLNTEVRLFAHNNGLSSMSAAKLAFDLRANDASNQRVPVISTLEVIITQVGGFWSYSGNTASAITNIAKTEAVNLEFEVSGNVHRIKFNGTTISENFLGAMVAMGPFLAGSSIIQYAIDNIIAVITDGAA